MKKFISIFLLLLSNNSFSQEITYSLSNYLRIGTGKENWGEGGYIGSVDKKYFDYYSDLRLIYDNFRAGFRYEYVNPPEFSLKKNKISRRFLEYNNGGINIRIGNSFTLWERGLALNLFENRSLGYDTNIDGINVDYLSKPLKVKLIYGNINFVEPSTILSDKPRMEKYLLKGAHLGLNVNKNFSFSGGLVISQNRFPDLIDGQTRESKSYLPEISFQYKSEKINYILSYVRKTSKYENESSTGSGIYSALSYSGDNLGLTLEYKDYRFDIVDPLTEINPFRTTRMLPFQNPPTVHKEHSFTLLTRYPHLVNFNDEVGFQVELFYSPSEKINYNFNLSAASKHFAYLFDRNKFKFVKQDRTISWLPNFSAEYNPFFEFYFETEYFLEQRESLIRTGFNYRSNIYFDAISEPNSIQPLKQFTFPFYFQYLFSDEYSIKISSESQWVLKYPETKYFYNQLISLQNVLYSNLSINGRFEFTTSIDEPNGDKVWFVAEAGYRLGTNHIFLISYGSERGGQICSNGLCRQVLPFTGLRFSVISNI